MALAKRRVIDKVEVVGEYSHIQIREDDQIVDDSNDQIESRGNGHRRVLSPGDDVSGESAVIQAIAGAAWTAEVVAAYEASQPS